MKLDQLKGVIFGQAIGDALGLGSEFMTRADVRRFYPDGLSRYDQIIRDEHRRRWHIGDWTDDTDMWLCIAKAIIDNKGEINLITIAKNFKDWHNGTPLGCGGHTNKVLSMSDYVNRAFDCSKLWWELSRKNAAANGALMRTSVLGLLPNYRPEMAEAVCKLTHFDPRCIGSCVIICSLINSLLYATLPLQYEQLLDIADTYDPRIRQYIIGAKESSFDSIVIDDYTMGYTLNTLFVTLWCYFQVNSFEEGLLKVVNAGGDADTNAAVTCSLLGAKFGFTSIPGYYWRNLYRYKQLLKVSEQLYKIVDIR